MAKKKKQDSRSLFRRLTRLFRSGPVVRRKIRGLDTAIAVPDKAKSSGTLLFQKSLAPTYATITAQAYNLSERLARYNDFQEMEYTPEIAAALDIYADETCAQDDKGRSLHIFSDNERIKEVLEDLFYNVLNIEFNLRSWVRNLCKYGDFFLYNDVSPDYGVVNAFPIPVNEIEREENFDREDPFAVRYRWVTLGNRTLENWEVSHFRLLGNDLFLPYGSSIIEPARRIWRQLILIEDAMLVYRVVRAPERRVFYIDVANVAPENVGDYVSEQKTQLRSQQVVDGDTGRVDLRYNPLSVDEDYFIPVRGNDTGTRIDTLQAGQNTGTVEDVEYIQKKLFASLKIPRAYLGYEEMLSSKATLAQEDIRFSRTIAAIQKVVIAELNKCAIIHLYANGFTDEDLINFTIRLSNPSTVAQQQKLEIWRAKFDIAGTMPEGMGSRRFAYKNVWSLTDDEIEEIEEDRWREKAVDVALEAVGEGGDEMGGGGGGGGGDLFGGDAAGPDLGGDEDIFDDDAGGGELDLGDEEPPPEENAGEEEPEEDEDELELLTSVDDADDEERFRLPKDEADGSPIKPKSDVRKDIKYRNSRRQTLGSGGTYATHTPDLNDMVADNEALDDPYDSEWTRSVVSNPFGESLDRTSGSRTVRLPVDVEAALRGMIKKFGPAPSTTVITEVDQPGDGVELDLDLNELAERWHDDDDGDVDIVIVEGDDDDDEWSDDDE